MRKSQIQIIPLIYVFAIIVAALILAFGLSYVFKLKNVGSDIELGKFKIELDKKISYVYNLDTGSVDKFSYRVPEKLNKVCFVDPQNKGFVDERLDNLIFVCPKCNLFFIMDEEDKYFEINGLKPETSPICFSSENKRIEFFLENKGKYVTPSE